MSLSVDEQFFYDNAGWSYRPGVESSEEGHVRTARRYAAAEKAAREKGVRFSWSEDYDADTSFDGWSGFPLWECHLYVPFHGVPGGEPWWALGDVLGGIDLGDCSGPRNLRTRPEYCRVIEAELANSMEF